MSLTARCIIMLHIPCYSSTNNWHSVGPAVLINKIILYVVLQYLPWELLYADDLVVIAETEEDLIKRLNEWKDFVENRGMRVVGNGRR